MIVQPPPRVFLDWLQKQPTIGGQEVLLWFVRIIEALNALEARVKALEEKL